MWKQTHFVNRCTNVCTLSSLPWIFDRFRQEWKRRRPNVTTFAFYKSFSTTELDLIVLFRDFPVSVGTLSPSWTCWRSILSFNFNSISVLPSFGFFKVKGFHSNTEMDLFVVDRGITFFGLESVLLTSRADAESSSSVSSYSESSSSRDSSSNTNGLILPQTKGTTFSKFTDMLCGRAIYQQRFDSCIPGLFQLLIYRRLGN